MYGIKKNGKIIKTFMDRSDATKDFQELNRRFFIAVTLNNDYCALQCSHDKMKVTNHKGKYQVWEIVKL